MQISIFHFNSIIGAISFQKNKNNPGKKKQKNIIKKLS